MESLAININPHMYVVKNNVVGLIKSYPVEG